MPGPWNTVQILEEDVELKRIAGTKHDPAKGAHNYHHFFIKKSRLGHVDRSIRAMLSFSWWRSDAA
jgi:hypothetical protein